MKHGENNRQMLIAYLLGKLPESEQEEVAARYFEDDVLFDQLLEVEDDLLNQYVRGWLGNNERSAFERYLKRLPDGQHKVAVAAALMNAAPAGAFAKAAAQQEVFQPILQTPVEAAPGLRPWKRFLQILLPEPQLALQYSLAGLIVVAAAIAWLIYEGWQQRQKNDQLLVQMRRRDDGEETLRQKVQSLEQQSDEQRAHTRQLQDQLASAQQRGQAQEQEIARLQETSPSSASLAFASGSSRRASLEPSPASLPDTLILKRNTQVVSLTVPVKEKEKYLSYRAVLQTTEGDRVWEQEGRLAQPSQLGASLVFRVPASHFISARYKLIVVFMHEDKTELSHDYYFDVVKR